MGDGKSRLVEIILKEPLSNEQEPISNLFTE